MRHSSLLLQVTVSGEAWRRGVQPTGPPSNPLPQAPAAICSERMNLALCLALGPSLARDLFGTHVAEEVEFSHALTPM